MSPVLQDAIVASAEQDRQLPVTSATAGVPSPALLAGIRRLNGVQEVAGGTLLLLPRQASDGDHGRRQVRPSPRASGTVF